MDVQNLRRLIAQGEHHAVEFKRHLPTPLKAARSVTALANSAGGSLLVGVEDDGQISGLSDPEATLQLIAEACHYIDPPLELNILQIPVYGSTVIVIQIPDSPAKPHYVPSPAGDALVYVRAGSSTQPAGPSLIKQLKSRVIEESSEIELTPLEQALLEYLSDQTRITLKQYSQLMNISERRARRILVRLVEGGLLNGFEHERETFYTLNRQPGS